MFSPLSLYTRFVQFNAGELTQEMLDPLTRWNANISEPAKYPIFVTTSEEIVTNSPHL